MPKVEKHTDGVRRLTAGSPRPVVIAEYSDLIETKVVEAMLRGEGIECRYQRSSGAGAVDLNVETLPGTWVILVSSPDAEHARAILTANGANAHALAPPDDRVDWRVPAAFVATLVVMTVLVLVLAYR